jgi:hypothetical protein
MEKRIAIIDVTPAPCAFCGKAEELRPYGPAGELVCFECGMKDGEEKLLERTRRFAEGFDEMHIKEGAKILALYKFS